MSGSSPMLRPALCLPLAPVAPPSQDQEGSSDGDSSGGSGVSRFRQRVLSHSRLRLDVDSPKKLVAADATHFSFPDPAVIQQGEEILQNFVYDSLRAEYGLGRHLPTGPLTSPFDTLIRTGNGKKLLKWNLLPHVYEAMGCCITQVEITLETHFSQWSGDLQRLTQVAFYRSLVDVMLCEEDLHLQVLLLLQASAATAARSLRQGHPQALHLVLAGASDLFRNSVCPKVAEEGGWEVVMKRPLERCRRGREAAEKGKEEEEVWQFPGGVAGEAGPALLTLGLGLCLVVALATAGFISVRKTLRS